MSFSTFTKKKYCKKKLKVFLVFLVLVFRQQLKCVPEKNC